jgi:hypothetical protein
MSAPSLGPGGGNTSVGALINGAVSCAGAGYCAMVGPYSPDGGDSSLVSGWIWSKTNGVWTHPGQIPGLPALNKGGLADPIAISCASAGNCAAGGSYLSAPVNGKVEAFVVSESQGVWKNAQPVPGAAARNAGGNAGVDLISCPAPGDCAAVGSYLDGTEHTVWFAADERGGSWGKAVPLPSVTSFGDVFIDSLSCPSPGNCAAVGDSASDTAAFTVNEAHGRWGKATRVAGTLAGPAGLAQVSCTSTGDCIAAGTYTPRRNGSLAAMRVNESGGHWGSAHTLPLGGDRAAWSISCPANGSCAVASTGHIVSEVRGVWGKPARVPAGYLVNSLSCTKVGYCGAAAYYSVTADSGFGSAIGVSDESAGRWGPWYLLPGTVLVNKPETGDVISAVSCGAPGNCALYGYAANQTRTLGQWAAGKETVPVTATTLARSAAKVSYGHEQAERISVTVLASAGTPAGSVTVTAGAATLCTVKLSGGKGGCTLPAKALAPGGYKLAATYGISTGFAPSRSGTVTLTVAK